MLNREQWLTEAVKLLRPVFREQANLALPDEVFVSVGWPSAGGLSEKRRVIGQCWPSETETPHIFISPLLDDPITVLGVLVHELVHAVCEPGTGHTGDFIKYAKELGLQKPWTSTTIGDDLIVWLTKIDSQLPDYPHTPPQASPKKRKVQSTRMLKATCEVDGYTVRLTQKWLDVGLPTCPCGKLLVMEVKE